MKSQSEPPIESAQSNGEEIGLLATEVAAHQFESEGGEQTRLPLDHLVQAPHDQAELWPDLPGVCFPEPYIVDIPWLMGLPRPDEEELSLAAEPGGLESTTALDLEDLESLELERTFIDLDRDELGDIELTSGTDELRTTQPDLAAIPEVGAAELTDFDDVAAKEAVGRSQPPEYPPSAPPIPPEEIERFEQESTFILLEGDDVEVFDTEDAAAVEPAVDTRPADWERRDTSPGTKLKAEAASLQQQRPVEAEESLRPKPAVKAAESPRQAPKAVAESPRQAPKAVAESPRPAPKAVAESPQPAAPRSARKASETLDELELDQEDIEEVIGKSTKGAIQRLQQHTPPLPADVQREWVEKGSTREMMGLHRRAGVEDLAEAGAASSTAKVLPLARPLNLRQRPEPKFTLPQPSVEDAFHMGYAGRELDPFEELALPEAVRAKAIPRARPWYEVIFDDSYFEILPPKLHQQTRREARLVYDTLRLQSRAQVLDMACGFGRHCFELVKLGYQMTGIDLSHVLIEKARAQAEQRQTHIDFRVGDMRDFDLESMFDGVILLGDSFGYFDDQSNADVLENLCRCLKPKGRFLLDVLNRDRILAEIPRVSWWRGGNCLVLEEVEFDFNFSRMMSKRTLLFEDGRPPWEQFIDVRIFSLHELVDIIESAGFRVCEITGSSIYPGLFFGRESRRIIVLAERV